MYTTKGIKHQAKTLQSRTVEQQWQCIITHIQKSPDYENKQEITTMEPYKLS